VICNFTKSDNELSTFQTPNTMFLNFPFVLPGRLLGKHCGANIPAAMDTGDSFAYVKFVSDASVSAPGFSLSFAASMEGTGHSSFFYIYFHTYK